MKRLSFALIGAGKMGERWAGVLSENKNVSLNVIVDSDQEKASNLTRMGIATSDVRSIVKLGVDAAVVVVPHKFLAPISEFALKNGIHVLCEKPGAITSRQIIKNSKIAKKMGVVYKIGYNYRFHDGFIKARKLVEKGAIGDILFIRARHGFGGRVGYNKEWRIDKELGGGGHLHDQGVHMIDLAKFFLGDVKQVRGFMADTFWKAGTEDNAFVLLQSSTGAIASIHSSLTQWKRMHSFEIYGTKGYLSVEGLGLRYSGDGENLIVGKRDKNFNSTEEVITCDSIADHSLAHELDEFIRSIKRGTPVHPMPYEAAETLKIVEDIYKTNKI